MLTIEDIWAKTEPPQSVRTHAIISGTVAGLLFRYYLSSGARQLLSKAWNLSENKTCKLLCYLVSLHDIGKIEPNFQRQDERTRQKLKENRMDTISPVGGVRHEKTGEESVRKLFETNGYDWDWADFLSRFIGAHHQGKSGRGACSRPPWDKLQADFEQEMREHFWQAEIADLPVDYDEGKGIVSVLLLGLLILSDWIASGSTFKDAENWIHDPDRDEIIERYTKRFLFDSGLEPGGTAWPESFCGLWPQIPENGRRPLQIETEKLMQDDSHRNLAVLIEAPMGEGKTEAAVFAALRLAKQWGKDGFYIALPTSATSNQMVGRIRAMMDAHEVPDTVRLLHAMAWLVDEQTPEEDFHTCDDNAEVRRWLAPVKRGLLGQYAVGTIDQTMLAASTAKYSVLRLLGLTNKALIIDEIHSYDVYMSGFLTRLLEWCRELEIPVIMLSATLPPKQKKELLAPYTTKPLSGAYPLITAVDASGEVTECVIPGTTCSQTVEVELKTGLSEPDTIAKLAEERVHDGGCLCVLMNTVKEAQRVYAELKKIYSGDLHLFHARFPAEDRAALERECMKLYGKDKSNRPTRSILVATQVVEQSLDVDFDAMITAVAPIDLILQRMGRVHRHDNSPRPVGLSHPSVWVVIPEEGHGFGVSEKIYPACLLTASARLLRDRDRISVPDDLALLVSAGYDENAAPPEEAEKWLDHMIEDNVKSGAADQYLLSPPTKVFTPLDTDALFDDEDASALSVKTRLGEPTVMVALLEKRLMDEIRPMLISKGTQRIAPIRDRKLARRIMARSLSVRKSEYDRMLYGLSDIRGDKMIAGLKILETTGGKIETEAGVIRIDSELGLIIERKGEA